MDTLSPEVDDCFAIRQAARQISKLYERHLSKVGLTPTQFSILSALLRRSNLTMAGLATALVMDRTTLVRVLKPLVQSQWIEESVENHSRRLRLCITERGRAKFDEAREHWNAAQAHFELRFGANAAASLRKELFRLTRDVACGGLETTTI